MSIKNINLVSKKNISNITPYVSEINNREQSRYVNALANLGQRTGTKGDSMSLYSISFNDLFDTNKDYDSYVGVMRYVLDDNNHVMCEYGYVSKDNMLNGDTSIFDGGKDTSDEILGMKFVDQVMSLDLIVNNIQLIEKNSLLKVDDNKFATLIFGKSVSLQQETYNKEIQYNVFDIENNTLDFAIRCWHLNSNSNNTVKSYMMMVISKSSDNEYDLNLYKMTIDNTDEFIVVNNTFDQYFSSTNNDFENTSFDSFSDIDIIDYKNILNEDSNNIFSYIKNNATITYNTIKLEYDQSKEYEFKIQDDQILKTNDYFKDKYGLSLEDRINYLSKDLSIVYPRLLEYYCNNLFFKDKKRLALHIFTKLYEKILIDHYKVDDEDASLSYILSNYEDPLTIYIPLSYSLRYYAPSSNSLLISSSKDIYVSFINTFSSSMLNRLFEDSNSMIIAKYDDINKSVAYNVKIEYSTTYDNVIQSFNIEKSFTLPYIDKGTGNWIINDEETSFKSYNMTTGLQNILIIHYYKDDEEIKYQILNNIDNDIEEILEIGGDEIWKERQCYFSSTIIDEQSSSNNNLTSILATCKIPKISQIYSSYFKNTILFTIFDKSVLEAQQTTNEQNNIVSSKSITEYFSKLVNLKLCAIWNFDDDSLQFDYIKEKDLTEDSDESSNYAFDASNIFNMRATAIRSTTESNNLFDEIGFKNQNDSLKDLIGRSIPTFIVYNSDPDNYSSLIESNNNLSEPINVNNNLILSIKAKDQLETQYNMITNPNLDKENDSRYLSFERVYDDKTGTFGSNALYQFKYNISSSNVTSSNDNSIYQVSKISKISSIGSLMKTLNEQKSIYDFLQSTNQANATSTTSNENLLSVNFNEYIFDYDVPLLDLKEIITMNSNTLNRLNILSLSSNNEIYHSFIGQPIYSDATLFDDSSDIMGKDSFAYPMYRGGYGSSYTSTKPQDVLQISSSRVDNNLGLDTMISKDDIANFDKAELLNVKFDNILIETNNITTRVSGFDNSQFIGALNAEDEIFDGTSSDNNSLQIGGKYSTNDPSNKLLNMNLGDDGAGDMTVLTKDFEPIGIVKEVTESKNPKFYQFFKSVFNYSKKSPNDENIWSEILQLDYSQDGSMSIPSNDLTSKDSTSDNFILNQDSLLDIVKELYNSGAKTSESSISFSENDTTEDFFKHNDNVNINSFFMYIKGLNQTNISDTESHGVNYCLDPQNLFSTTHEDIYIFRLSDYLYRIFGLDMTSLDPKSIEEEFGFSSRIFGIKIHPNLNLYTYFVIFLAHEVEVKDIDFGNQYFKIAKLTNHIQLMKYKINDEEKYKIFLNLNHFYI